MTATLEVAAGTELTVVELTRTEEDIAEDVTIGLDAATVVVLTLDTTSETETSGEADDVILRIAETLAIAETVDEIAGVDDGAGSSDVASPHRLGIGIQP